MNAQLARRSKDSGGLHVKLKPEDACDEVERPGNHWQLGGRWIGRRGFMFGFRSLGSSDMGRTNVRASGGEVS